MSEDAQKTSFAEKFITKFFADDTTTLAASLAFYTALSLAPLLILFVTVSAQLSDRLMHSFISQVQDIVGEDGAHAVEMVVNSAKTRPDLSSFAGSMGVFTLLVSASLIFGQLRVTLNRIFNIAGNDSPVNRIVPLIFSFFRERILHIGLAISFIISLIVSLGVTAQLGALVHPESLLMLIVMNVGATVLFYVILFTLIFRYLPDRRLPWSWAVQGGALTAVLFVVGKELIGIYLGRSAVGSSYGAAGSLIVLLVWVYYSALITFVGAQVSALLNQNRQISS